MLQTKHTIQDILGKAVTQAAQRGLLPDVAMPEILIERPQNPEHGDYASNLPLKLARIMGKNPMEIAGHIAAHIDASTPQLGEVSVANPGFINFKLNNEWVTAQVDSILNEGDNFGHADIGKGESIQLEFVSVNPTGPLHVGHGRGAILGSALASILEAAGYKVQKEYYVNDAGNQIDLFARSLYARYLQAKGEAAEVPEDGYQGAYMEELGKEVAAELGDALVGKPEAEAMAKAGAAGLTKMLGAIKDDLATLGVTFDEWFSEKSLYESGQYDAVMKKLRQSGHIAEKENATWFISTAMGEDKDNVIVRGDGSPTYFAADIAYHYNKLVERGFDRVIDIWGADHLGHVSRMKVVMEALGVDPDRLRVLISQMVTLRRGGELVRISKRSGDIITLKELVEEVGADACRFIFLSRTADAQMDFDMDLAKKQSADNPVYYVQYAHARIASILRLAGEKGVTADGGNPAFLTNPSELALIRKMLLLPEIIELIAATMEPHHLTYFAQDLATTFHAFYNTCRVVSDKPELTAARLKLVTAAKTVLGRTLGLLGMTAPEHM
ncbi:arginine--tRNA ligase [Chloroflexota bacterium]